MKNCDEFFVLGVILSTATRFIRKHVTYSLLNRCKYSLNDNLIVLLKPDIDLDMSRPSIQNAVS